METTMAGSWWMLVLRGIAAILFGLVAFFSPGLALTALVLLFGAYALVDGVFAVIAGIGGGRRQDRWWALLLEGLVGIITGIIAFGLPDITALALVFVIAAWALLTGALEIIAAIQLRKEIGGEWMLALSGALSIIFGVLLVASPLSGAVAIVWLIGGYALVFGVLLIGAGWRARGHHQSLGGGAPKAV